MKTRMVVTVTLTDRLHQKIFSTVYDRSLVYNQCWEDPALDRVALALTPTDTVAMITSAGCNALDYCLDAPARIHAVDANPRQTALLEMKLAGIRTLDYDDFFACFGQGRHQHFEDLYRTHLRPELSPFAQQWWDGHQHWLSPKGKRPSFYFYGLSGLVARTFHAWLRHRPKLRSALDALMAAPDLQFQQAIYLTEVEPRLFTRGMNWALSRRLTMSLLGVPAPQRQAVQDSHPDGVAGFIRSAMRGVFHDLPIANNYFWQVYLRGHYTPDCCPRYLTIDGFSRLKGGLVDRIEPYTGTLTDFLKGGTSRISRFVLLDHMDWMGSQHPDLLSEEWHAIIDRAAPLTRILFRSAAPAPQFLDRMVINRGGPSRHLGDLLRYDRTLAALLHPQDRVGTYASFHIADLVAA